MLHNLPEQSRNNIRLAARGYRQTVGLLTETLINIRDRTFMKETTFRGKLITLEQVIQAMERFDHEFRATFPKRKWVTYAVEHNDQLYPPKTIIRMVTGGSVPGGGKPVNSKFEDLGFTIVTLDEPPEPVVNPPDSDEDAIETALSLEYDLENSLVGNLGQLEKGLQLRRHCPKSSHAQRRG